jgi:hypothetical protein
MKITFAALSPGELLQLLDKTTSGDKAARDRVHSAFLPLAYDKAREAAKRAPHLLEDLQQEAAAALSHALACICWRDTSRPTTPRTVAFLGCAQDWIGAMVDGAVELELGHGRSRSAVKHANRVIDPQSSVDSRAREQVALMYADCPETGPDSLEEWTAVHEGITRVELLALGLETAA